MQLTDLFAEKFAQAFYGREWPGPLEPHISELSTDQAYQVQDQVATRRIAQGERVVGYKVGCTSAAIRAQFGLSEPISGRLFEPHIHAEGMKIECAQYVNCAIEPEMVLTTRTDLHGIDLPDDQLVAAIDSVRPGIELHNFCFWYKPPTSQELICSGGIHAGLIIGDAAVDPHSLSFDSEIFSVYKDSAPVTAAPAREIMGGPLHSLRWLVNALTRRGSRLKKGSLIIPGSPVELVRVDRDVELGVEIEKVGGLVSRFLA